ncbi:hypothetical protein [Desulfosporosinus sp. BICA1-9]|uniref:hypothetical protein n=1 Tax=Desulfosporosinus sp. BICA1-9 TaxID=1531958 RepID=UPI00054B8FC4|nr:hypothetical protein [Desulfosporosinus sp. BICA1-9]KJS49733.1 MAG: membrane protein [Peptococcaceae bacterium BRH_c23]KJS88585.1 MAG: membrane protein [Desulfosporosinus sp. BICA1-9]HBW35310.1 hypothetical protein [Desulfosporosinus sp.]
MDKPKPESKLKPNPDDLRRMIGYTMITFMGVFLFIPIVWFIHLISQDSGLYVRWGICSAFLVVFNMLFYYWRYPVNWLRNLMVLVGINLFILIFEYFWLMQSVG